MITLTRLDGKELVVNADHILTAERTPDTVLLLSTGLKLMVREEIPEILERVAAWRRRIGTCVATRDDRWLDPAPHAPHHLPAEAGTGDPEDPGATVLSFPRGVPSEE